MAHIRSERESLHDPVQPSCGAPRPPGLSAAAEFAPAPVQLRRTAARLGQQAAYYVRTDNGWVATSWADFAADVQAAARALLALDVKHGEAVAILGFNRPEWSVMALAAMTIGAIPAGIYWTASSDDIEYILDHSGARVLLCEHAEHFAKVQRRLDRLPRLQQVVMMRGAPTGADLQCGWDAFLALGARLAQAEVDRRLQALRPEDTGSLIYTSGTTGPAKAVVLSHANLCWSAAMLCQLYDVTPRDRMLSYLPFAHIAEQLGCIHNQVWGGFAVYFARSMDELGLHLKEVRPTIFFGVPRVWEKMHAAIEAKLTAATGIKAVLARWALQVGQRWHEVDLAGRRPGLLLDLQRRLANRLIYRKVKQALGFDDARLLMSGAAPIAPDNLRFFTGLDLVVREVYGQSEVCGPTTLSLIGQTRFGSVGKPLPGLELKLGDDGEILVRGPNVFQGYAGRPDDTREALQDGWLRSGDLGYLDADGYLYINGRKKDLIITSGGKNISPANLESGLMNLPLVEHAVACGDGRHFLTALLTLNPESLAAFALEHGLPSTRAEDLHDHPILLAALQAGIDELNTHHARVEQIRKFAVLPRTLTVEAGELTPTLKVRRKLILERERERIDALYSSASSQTHERP